MRFLAEGGIERTFSSVILLLKTVYLMIFLSIFYYYLCLIIMCDLTVLMKFSCKME